jgi:hypothetical protein
MSLAHGKYTIEVEGNIILLRLFGAFNEQGTKLFTTQMIQTIDALNKKPFCILVNDLEVTGGTPEAYAELERYNQWLNKQKLLAKAMVIKSAVTLAIIDRYAPARQQQNIAVFDNEPDAISWLKSTQNLA